MITQSRKQQLQEIEKKLGTKFISFDLIDRALTHSSFVNENKRKDLSDNERIEFLGDAVLKLAVSDYLYLHYPEKNEGDLTKIRAAVVSDLSLSEKAKNLNIGQYLLLGENEKLSGGDKKKSNLANALEAIIASIYLDSGLEEAKKVVINLLKDDIEKAASEGFIIDYKSALQELCQKNKWGLPFYKVLKELGPKHNRIFLVEVRIKGLGYGFGRGRTKKEAEQSAAKTALTKVKNSGLKEPFFKNVIFGLLGKKGKQ